MQHQTRPVQHPVATRPVPGNSNENRGRGPSADDEPSLSAYEEPSPDEMPLDFDAPRVPQPIRQRIAAAAGEGQQRAATRRPWGP
jgi:hypothetical protein